MAWFYKWVTCMNVHKWPDMDELIFISVEERVTPLWVWEDK
jgi:hypothetical protein